MKSPILFTIFYLLIYSAGARAAQIYAGLLTDDYGIVKMSDLNEEGQLSKAHNFPKDPFEHYWQCVKVDKYELGCEIEGRAEPEGWIIGEAIFKIHSGNKIIDIGTRRNWDMGFCKKMISDIRAIIKKEPVVCFSAIFVGENANTSEWVVDQVKTKKGQWSWFGDPKLEKRYSSKAKPH